MKRNILAYAVLSVLYSSASYSGIVYFINNDANENNIPIIESTISSDRDLNINTIMNIKKSNDNNIPVDVYIGENTGHLYIEESAENKPNILKFLSEGVVAFDDTRFTDWITTDITDWFPSIEAEYENIDISQNRSIEKQRYSISKIDESWSQNLETDSFIENRIIAGKLPYWITSLESETNRLPFEEGEWTPDLSLFYENVFIEQKKDITEEVTYSVNKSRPATGESIETSRVDYETYSIFQQSPGLLEYWISNGIVEISREIKTQTEYDIFETVNYQDQEIRPATSDIRIISDYLQDEEMINLNSDLLNVTQNSLLTIPISDLLSNDIPYGSDNYVYKRVENIIGGSISLNGSNLEFSPTSRFGEDSGFSYVIQNERGFEQKEDVTIIIDKLPEKTAFVFSTNAEAQDYMTVYVPPTPQEIFNNWARVDGANYFTDSSTATGEAATWQFLTSPNRILQTANTASPNMFISTYDYSNYDFQATLFSDNADDDAIGLVIAFVRDGGINKSLVLSRTKGGLTPAKGFGISYQENGAYVKMYNNVDVGGVVGGWSGQKSTVKINRNQDLITVAATPWNSSVFNQSLTLDLNSYPELSVFKGSSSYGYFTHSQANSTYLDVSFKGSFGTSGAEFEQNKVYVAETGLVWIYDDIAQVWSNSGTIQSDTDYPVTLKNFETGALFEVEASTVTEL